MQMMDDDEHVDAFSLHVNSKTEGLEVDFLYAQFQWKSCKYTYHFHENTRGFTLTEVGPEARKLLRQHLLTGPWKRCCFTLGSRLQIEYTPEDQRLELKNPPQLKKNIIFQIIIFRFPVHLPGWSTWSDHDDSSNFAGRFSEWWFARLDSEEDAKRKWVFACHIMGTRDLLQMFQCLGNTWDVFVEQNAQSQCWWIHLGRLFECSPVSQPWLFKKRWAQTAVP